MEQHKPNNIHTVFTRISAAALILFEGGAYLKFGRRKESYILQ